ncbi:MAG: ComEC/Rec2 family competence protein [Pseudomonadota bacterium]
MAEAISVEFRRAILWFPVGMGFGIALYLGWHEEPPAWVVVLPLVPLGLLLRGLGERPLPRVLLIALLALTTGHAAAQLATWRAAMATLPWQITATVEGRVVWLDRAASGAPRVLLDQVSLFGRAARQTPERVRLTLSAVGFDQAPRPGQWVRVYARLGPPGRPVEPGGFDFARRAFFDRIGAIGYARTPPVTLPNREVAGPRGRDRVASAGVSSVVYRLGAAIARWRLAVADAVRRRLDGPPGAFAAAILVGDRSAIDERDAEALRISTLAHLLAISGLHMGLLSGLVFAAMRIAFALVGRRALRLPSKKLAAVASLAAAFGYLLASGASVATQRAFIMVAVVFIAVLADRPALTLRAVALAAVLVLAWRPISLTDPGFQMSFAATVALIALFEALSAARARRDRLAAARDRPETGGTALAAAGDGAEAEGMAPGAPRLAISLIRVGRAVVGRIARGALTVTLTSVVAGLATAPVAAFHFNRVGTWGLLANLAAVPVMGAWIAPAGVAAALAAPFGAAGPFLDLMGIGIDWVLSVAHAVAGLPGASRPVASMPVAALVTVMMSGLWLMLWRGGWRYGGAVLGGVAVIAMPHLGPPRPAVLIAPGGGLVGVMTASGRALDHPRAERYAAQNWLEADGDAATQEEAALRHGFLPALAPNARRRAAERVADVALDNRGTPWRLIVLRGKGTALERHPDACRAHTLIIAPGAMLTEQEPCLVINDHLLKAGSAVAITPGPEGPLIVTEPMIDRPWFNR